ncbi:MAG: MotA/TolQ/ExbB proton channel family protein [Candidatus Krumholzibacteriia bacterium]
MDSQLVVPFADIGRSFVSLMFDSGAFAKVILLILFVMSVTAWAIIFDRTRLYLRLRRGGGALQTGLASRGLNLPMETVKRCLPSIEGALVLETKAYMEGKDPSSSKEAAHDRSQGQLKDLLDGRAVAEISEMEKYLIFLSTTASVAPFLGLLGTVWGIMSSFLSMGVQGTASIEVVGPGIAEALVTTIAGLGTAITALVGYNLLVRHVRRQETRVELFISRILALTAGRIGESHSYTATREASYEEKSV